MCVCGIEFILVIYIVKILPQSDPPPLFNFWGFLLVGVEPLIAYLSRILLMLNRISHIYIYIFIYISPQATLLVPQNYMGEKRFIESQYINEPGKHQFRLPCVPVRSSGTVILEMIDKNGFYFTDEFALSFHMHYYRLMKWMVALPMLGMFCILLWLHPETGAALPSFSRDR